ncbi:DUF1329 domain-containing protein [Pseudomonas sp. JAI111]|uniref:DUF1329 domain-containing protein n=1 Tax=Pseudomonas sp. JAI111 TaxID=2735913 RepID=UPI0021670C50|nr:DUF1329 domain-containing protein [Pseudomonas sp. JAI111]
MPMVMTAMVATLCSGSLLAAVSTEEASALGKTLTPCGAEIAGNKDGTIPAYTGGLTSLPGYDETVGKVPDPFPNDKPLYSITAQNYMDYADKLSEGSKELFKRNPSWRMDVYQTRRTVALSQYNQDACLKNAREAKLEADGMKIVNAKGGVPFPIPKTGLEVMWNHLAQPVPIGWRANVNTWYVSGGKPVLASGGDLMYYFPWQDPNAPMDNVLTKGFMFIKEPIRQAGQGIAWYDTADASGGSSRRAWAYIPGQRRVRATPDADFDTPAASQGGAIFYDDVGLFYGTPSRFDFKLVGKKEMLIPYNTYKMWHNTPAKDLLQAAHVNPDVTRWELHRVFVVEGTLKAGQRHSYAKRVFYFDEDTFGGGISDNFDHSGKLYRSVFAITEQISTKDQKAPYTMPFWAHDFSSNVYLVSIHMGEQNSNFKAMTKSPAPEWGPEGLKRASLR